MVEKTAVVSKATAAENTAVGVVRGAAKAVARDADSVVAVPQEGSSAVWAVALQRPAQTTTVARTLTVARTRPGVEIHTARRAA